MNSLWKIPDVTSVRTPLSIIKEQASALTSQTRGSLRGVVATTNYTNGYINITLSIEVPALNSYRFLVFSFTQPIGIYPAELEFPLKQANFPIPDEEALNLIVGQILGSSEMQQVVANLLAQANT